MTDKHELPEPQRHYPVIVTVTYTHVVWVEGDTPSDAVANADYDTYDLLDDRVTLADADITIAAPGRWSRDLVDGTYRNDCSYTREHDAHVRLWRLVTGRSPCR